MSPGESPSKIFGLSVKDHFQSDLSMYRLEKDPHTVIQLYAYMIVSGKM